MHLGREVDWALTFRSDSSSHEITSEKRESAPSEAEIAAYAYGRAQKGEFQYLYDHCRIDRSAGADEGESGSDLLSAFLKFLNAPQTLEFIRSTTGFSDITYANGIATRYRPGHFLTQHDDHSDDDHRRRVAYVFNLTPEWRSDWGGLLQFIDTDGHVAEAFCPRYNALNLFSVPQMHAVSLVAPFAAMPRLSVTGWFWAE